MKQRHDQIFQVSLTEIAFCITFMLLLLLGHLVVKEQQDRKAAEDALAHLESIQSATAHIEAATAQMEGVKAALQQALGNTGAINPDDIISKLVEADKAVAERDRLRKRVEDLDAKLTALVEIQKLLEGQPGGASDTAGKNVADALILKKIVREQLGASTEMTDMEQVKQAIDIAKTLREEIRKQLQKEPGPAEEIQVVVGVVKDAASYAELAKTGANADVLQRENSGLRGQVAFLKRRLDARGGRDFPPCWADESGKVEFVLAIELKADTVAISQAWPARRALDAKALPGLAEALSQSLTYGQFPSAVQALSDWSKKQDPECRHYVQLKSSIPDAVQSDRARLMVENYFYKVEVRR